MVEPLSHREDLEESLNHGSDVIPISEPRREGPEEPSSLNLGLDDIIIVSTTSFPSRNSTPEPIDVDSLPDNPTPRVPSCTKPKHPIQPCSGIIITPPLGKSVHTLYPFALHESLGDLWNYSVTAGKFVLHSRGCNLRLDDIHSQPRQTNQCPPCSALSENANVIGIIDRIQDGVHISAPFHYHGVGGLITVLREKAGNVRALRLRGLNNAKKLVVKVRALDMHKQFIMAIGSTKVERIERLIRASIAQNCGIRKCLELLDKAAQQVYRTHNYTEEDELRGLLLWRLGGGRVADIAHRALGLPSVRTLRRRTLIPRLTPSAGQPTLEEVESNTVACTSIINDMLKVGHVVHQVLMFDEIKVEERPRWDDKSNNIIGVCREHSKNTSLQYTSKDEVDLLFSQILDEKIHLASNVCSSRSSFVQKSCLTSSHYSFLGDCRCNWSHERRSPPLQCAASSHIWTVW